MERAADAAVMFWQSLDPQERKMLAVGVAWVVYMIVQVPLEQARRQRDRDELADAVAERLMRRAS
jgi:type II secretory pathway component PulM